MEQNERFKNEIDSLKSTFTPIKSFMVGYEQLEKYVYNSITELNGRMLLVEEEMNFVKQFKDTNKFVLGNTFNKLSKKVLELEKEISTEKDIVAGKFNSLSNIATTDVNDSAAKHDAILQKVTSLNHRMQCFPSQIKQIADEKYYLAARIAKLEELYQHRSTVVGNESKVTPNVTPKSTNLVLSSDLMLFDSNGKFLKPELVNKQIKCQFVYIPTLESIEVELQNATIEKVPSQILINVGINNLDKQSTAEVCSLYGNFINFIQIKFPQADLYLLYFIEKMPASPKKPKKEKIS